MIAAPFLNRNFIQLCWVVPDLRAAVDGWIHTCGVGPFFWFDRVTFDGGRCRGQPADFPEIKAAIAYAGDIQIELVCQENDRPSFWRDTIPKGEWGFHDAALWCKDYDAERAAYTKGGAEIAFEGHRTGFRACWIDTRSTIGFMIQLIEANPTAEAIFAKMHAAAKNWDGKDPIRGLG
jgi:hypothetical protein